MKTISIICEGGLGDFLAATRFIPAIKKAHPDSELILYSNTDNNSKQAELITTLFPEYFVAVNQVTRSSQEYYINSSFGREKYNSAYLNIVEEDRKKIENADLVYNLHIDSLEFQKVPNWLNYFQHFTPPSINLENFISDAIRAEKFADKKYIMCHLMARPNGDYELESWYRNKLIKTLEQQLPSDYFIYIICQKDYFDVYKDVASDRVKVIDGTLLEIFYIAQNCQQFLGIDSGIRYFSLHFGKPTWVFSKYCNAPSQIAFSHLIRWLIFPNYVLPNHYDINQVIKNITNAIQHPAYALYPQIKENIEQYIVERKIQ